MPAQLAARRPPLALDPLEARETPAGVVHTSLITFPGGGATILVMTGDDLDNSVRIEQTGNSVEVIGLDGTTVTGAKGALDLIGIRANFKGGNDSLTFDTGPGPLSLSVASAIHLGDGDNTLTLKSDTKLTLGGLSVLAGTGQDRVTIQGGAGAGSEVTGNLTASLGAGKAPAPPADTSSRLEVRNVAVRGTGGLRYTAAAGNDAVVLDAVDVDRAVAVSAGAGALAAQVTGSALGSALFAAGTNHLFDPRFGTQLVARDTTATGAVTVRSAGSAGVILRDVTTGPLAVQSGPRGYTDSELRGTVTVNGNLTFTGFGHYLYQEGLLVENPPDDGSNYGEPSTLKVTGDIRMSGSGDAVDIQTYGSVIDARNLILTGPDPNYLQDYDQDYGDSVLRLSGNLVLRGGDPYFSQRDGVAVIGGNVLLAGRGFAGLDSNHSVIGEEVHTQVGGSVTLTAAAGDAVMQVDGTRMTVGGNLTLTGALRTDLSYVTEQTSTVAGSVTLTGGPSADSFWVGGHFESGPVTLNFRGGDNWAVVGSPDAARPTRIDGNLRLTAGGGIDSVTVVNATVAGTTNLSTGGGNDELILQSGVVFEGAVAVNLGVGNDLWTAGFEVPDPFDPNEPPVVPAGPVRFNATSTVRMGAGNDTARLGVPGDPAGKVVVAAGATLTADGGLNVDTYAAGENEGEINVIGFES